jgi:predicted secreted Zn-dependent protease
MPRNIVIACVGMFALCPAAVLAQIYKCEVAGKTEFRDQPCAGGAAKPMALQNGSVAQGNIDFRVNTNHYPVNGADLAAAYQSLRVRGPSGFAGWARWNVKYEYMSKPAPSGCMISAVTIRIDAEIMMPQWVEEKNASLRDQSSWQTMYYQLKRHEDGHVQHGREFALLLKERLMGIGAIPCAQLQARSEQEYQRLYENLKNRDAEYDRRTDHGLR